MIGSLRYCLPFPDSAKYGVMHEPAKNKAWLRTFVFFAVKLFISLAFPIKIESRALLIWLDQKLLDRGRSLNSIVDIIHRSSKNNDNDDSIFVLHSSNFWILVSSSSIWSSKHRADTPLVSIIREICAIHQSWSRRLLLSVCWDTHLVVWCTSAQHTETAIRERDYSILIEVLNRK